MSPDPDRSQPALEVTSEATGWIVGLGIVTIGSSPSRCPGSR
jgi:hypothetical protein